LGNFGMQLYFVGKISWSIEVKNKFVQKKNHYE